MRTDHVTVVPACLSVAVDCIISTDISLTAQAAGQGIQVERPHELGIVQIKRTGRGWYAPKKPLMILSPGPPPLGEDVAPPASDGEGALTPPESIYLKRSGLSSAGLL